MQAALQQLNVTALQARLLQAILDWRIESGLRTQGWTAAAIRHGPDAGRTPPGSARQAGA